MTLTTTSSSRRWSALALIVTAQFMVILDVAIVNVALPSIKSDLGFSATSLQWVVSAYAILFGGALLLGGRLADLVGRRRLFIIGLLVFSASSLLCGLAWSEASLIAFRALQGLGGALLAPAALSLLVTSFAEGRERNLALGIYGAASGSGAAVGVLLGGLLTSYLNWSWIFFINVPVGIAAALLAPVLLRESRPDLGHRHFDFAGAATVTGGLMLFVYALTRGRTTAGARRRRCRCSAASIALIGAFLVIELRSPWPLLPLRIFRSRTLVDGQRARWRSSARSRSRSSSCSRSTCRTSSATARFRAASHSAASHSPSSSSRTSRSSSSARVGVRTTLTAGLLMSAASVALSDAAAGRRPLLLGHVPGLRARRRGHGPVVRPGDDREPRRRQPRGRRHRVRPREHEPADRRRDRHRRGDRDRRRRRRRTSAARPPAASSRVDHGYRTALYALTALLVLGAALTGALLRTPAPAPVAELRSSEARPGKRGGMTATVGNRRDTSSRSPPSSTSSRSGGATCTG